jgi:hypothetical protein
MHELPHEWNILHLILVVLIIAVAFANKARHGRWFGGGRWF